MLDRRGSSIRKREPRLDFRQRHVTEARLVRLGLVVSTEAKARSRKLDGACMLRGSVSNAQPSKAGCILPFARAAPIMKVAQAKV